MDRNEDRKGDADAGWWGLLTTEVHRVLGSGLLPPLRQIAIDYLRLTRMLLCLPPHLIDIDMSISICYIDMSPSICLHRYVYMCVCVCACVYVGADVWDEGLDGGGVFVRTSDGGRGATLVSHAPKGTEMRYTATCSKYRLGEVGVDRKWTIRFDFDDKSSFAIGLVKRDLDSDFTHKEKGDFPSFNVVWVDLAKKWIVMDGFCLFFNSSHTRLPGVLIHNVSIPGYVPTPGGTVTLEFHFSQSLQTVTVAVPNTLEPTVLFSGTQQLKLDELMPYFGIQRRGTQSSTVRLV